MVDPNPAPKTPLEEKTQAAFVTLNQLTKACHCVLNIVLVPPSPKPDWFDDLNSKLGTTKTHATDWIDNIAAGAASSVPVQVINYGTTYAALAPAIQAIAAAHPAAKGANDPSVQQVRQQVAALEQQLKTIVAANETTATRLKSWGDVMQAADRALIGRATGILESQLALGPDDIAVLRGLAESPCAVSQRTADATKALSEFRALWPAYEDALENVLASLDRGDTALGTIVEGAFTKTATDEWADATAFAQSLADAP